MIVLRTHEITTIRSKSSLGLCSSIMHTMAEVKLLLSINRVQGQPDIVLHAGFLRGSRLSKGC